ncbi:hypothetical protein CDL15_Pgr023176 [Punica granatum]|uniref:Uncharacterized protein n=1 Tax=Punica granatum TaxID=22663 RepID=A0A218X4C2_PUNGR|nr:hypothetical protein CDL15_Pgr023176 [Punica granatum]PKI64211.1 hypothetical protein CRG98_015398 [Punica granatum]
MAIEFTQFHKLVKVSSLGNLLNEIMIDILLRLPVKSICRFKCASKPWKALLSNLKFVELHFAWTIAGNRDYLLIRGELRRLCEALVEKGGESSKEPKELFSLRSKETLKEFLKVKVPFESKTGYYTMVDLCNGLVCLMESDEEGMFPFLNAFLWNLANEEFRSLPWYYVNRFTNQVTVSSFGFMFHPEMKDYLVVRIVYLTDSKSYEVEVYWLSNDQWKVIDVDLNGFFQEGLSQVSVNGALHWVVTKGEKVTNQQYFVLSLDVKEEKYAETPNGPNTSAESLFLIICKLFKAYDTWFLMEYGKAESWVKLYSVQFKGEPMKTLHVLDENRILMERSDNGGEVLLCDAKFQIIKDLGVFKPVCIVRHIESLSHPCGEMRTRGTSTGSPRGTRLFRNK